MPETASARSAPELMCGLVALVEMKAACTRPASRSTIDMVLIMTVEPGFGGQKFLDLCLPKIRTARELMRKHGVETWLQVDGGVSLETIERCAEAGADVFVAGSAVYSADDPDTMVRELRARAEAAAT